MPRVVATVLLVAALAACTDSGRSDATDPCLLQPSEIAAITNATIGAGSRSSRTEVQPAIAFCRYTTSASFGAITFAVQRPGQLVYDEAKTRAESGAGPLPPYEAITGLGDNAFSEGNSVSVLQGDVYVTVQAQNPNSDFAAIAQQLARQALSHL